jgi:hypothetical protein
MEFVALRFDTKSLANYPREVIREPVIQGRGTLPKWVLRQAIPDDRAFIMNSWLKTFEKSAYRLDIPMTEFFAFHHDVLEDLLERSSIIVAIRPPNPLRPDNIDEIYGYLCVETDLRPRIIHFLYVKNKYRKMGVGRSLVEDWLSDVKEPVFYSHRTEDGDAFAPHVFRVAEWNPYLMFIPWPHKLKIPGL